MNRRYRMIARAASGRALTLVVAAAFAATVVCGLWGWVDLFSDGSRSQATVWLDAGYQTMKAFVFGDEYDRLADRDYDWRLQVARWTGAVTALAAILRAGALLFSGPLGRLRAYQRRGHAVVIGDGPVARIFAEHWADDGRRVTHHAGEQEHSREGVLTVRRFHDLNGPRMRRSLWGANRVVVAETDDSTTAETAQMLAARMPRTPIFAVVKNPWLGSFVRHAADGGDGPGDMLTSVSENAAAARSVLAKHPPFLLAQRAGQTRIHAVIAGFDGLGSEIARDMLNSSLVSALDRPVFTIIDPQAEARRAAFLGRHPGLCEHIDFAFITGDAAALGEAGEAELRARAEAHPVTAAYIAVCESATPLACAAALLQTMQLRIRSDAPIFVRARRGAGLKPAPGGAALEPGQLVAFGGWAEVLEASGLLDDAPDAAARSYHERYMEFVTGKPADTPWEKLAEAYRKSNRRAVAHIPAKLASLGFDLEPYLAGKAGADPLSPNAAPPVAEGEALYRDEAELEAIARLEHERWMMDRWLGGWRFGEERDNRARIHPDLRPYDDLDELTRSYDRKLAEWLGGHLQRSKSGVRRPG